MKAKHLGLIVALAIVGVMAADTFSKSATTSYVSAPATTVFKTTPSVSAPAPVSTKNSSVAIYTIADVSSHASQSSCWTTISGKVYDLTNWIGQHPGGEGAILSICGKDGTSAFENQHSGSGRANSALATFFIGNLSQ